MDLDRLEQLLPKLNIRDKQTKKIIPFVPNKSQHLFISKLRELEKEKKPLWIITLKARQVGISTLTEAMLLSHCIAKANASAMILAHQFASSKELYGMARLMRDSLPVELPEPTQREMLFPHSGGQSTLKVATAGSKMGGRGMSLTALHMSEAAFYGEEGDIFTSLLNAVPYSKDTLVIVESTANGKSGQGENFYRMWTAAIQGYSNFLPIFIPWTMDENYVYNAELFEDGPQDEEEEELLRMGLSPEQMAWRRWAIENKCSGSPETFKQEYPITWNEAFVSSGNPAFETHELNWARKSVKENTGTSKNVTYYRSPQGQVDFKIEKHGGVTYWEKPVKGHRYYIGADVGRGNTEDEDDYRGDFSAYVMWNGTTGEQAARYSGHIGPEELANQLDMVGRFYNMALINIELTGGWGTWTQKVLRDTFRYPKLYRWKGSKDDSAPGRDNRNRPLGFDTTMYSRRLIFAAFREALRDKRVVVKDDVLLTQMESATYMDNYSQWGVKRGHDDVLMAALIAWLAVEQYPPPRKEYASRVLPTEGAASRQSRDLPVYSPDVLSILSRHFRQVRREKKNDNRLHGV